MEKGTHQGMPPPAGQIQAPKEHPSYIPSQATQVFKYDE